MRCIVCGKDEPDHHCTPAAEAAYLRRLKAMDRRLDRDCRPSGRDFGERLAEGFQRLGDE